MLLTSVKNLQAAASLARLADGVQNSQRVSCVNDQCDYTELDLIYYKRIVVIGELLNSKTEVQGSTGEKPWICPQRSRLSLSISRWLILD